MRRLVPQVTPSQPPEGAEPLDTELENEEEMMIINPEIDTKPPGCSRKKQSSIKRGPTPKGRWQFSRGRSPCQRTLSRRDSESPTPSRQLQEDTSPTLSPRQAHSPQLDNTTAAIDVDPGSATVDSMSLEIQDNASSTPTIKADEAGGSA